MARKEGPEIEFYEGFKVADSFQKFVTAGDLGGTKERLVLYGQREDGTVDKIEDREELSISIGKIDTRH